jgi:Domain of unknown function (DUF4158)
MLFGAPAWDWRQAGFHPAVSVRFIGARADLVSAKRTDTRLPFALLLKFYGQHGRFPRSRGELHPDAVKFVARALKADPASVAAYDWSGRSIERHHGQIRRHWL